MVVISQKIEPELDFLASRPIKPRMIPGGPAKLASTDTNDVASPYCIV